MSFSDFPFIPEAMGDKSHDPRRFPSHTEVQAWLEVFAARYDLRQHIRFNSQIISLRPIPPANASANPDASAAVDTAPRWKLTVQQSSAATDSNAKQQASQTCYATGTSHANANAVDPPELMSRASPTEAPTTEPASQSSINGTACQNNRVLNSNDGLHAKTMTNGMTQRPGAAAVDVLLTTGCIKACDSQHTSDSQMQDASCNQLPDAHAFEQSQYEFDAVVVCVGNYHQPNLPDVRGIDDFPGLQMHAHNYRSAAMFTGKTVIIVGASFSGETLSWLQQPYVATGCKRSLYRQHYLQCKVLAPPAIPCSQPPSMYHPHQTPPPPPPSPGLRLKTCFSRAKRSTSMIPHTHAEFAQPSSLRIFSACLKSFNECAIVCETSVPFVFIIFQKYQLGHVALAMRQMHHQCHVL